MNVIVLVFCFLGYLNLVKAKGNEDKLLRKIFGDARRPITHPNIQRRCVNPPPPFINFMPLWTSKPMLMSAVKFPNDDPKLVYGNLDNLGITYDETPLRILNTGFRKENNMLARILKSAKERGFNINMDNPSMIIIQQKKLKSGSKGNELKDKTSKIMEFLKTIKNSRRPITHPNIQRRFVNFPPMINLLPRWPSKSMLMSAVKFPNNDPKLVYGNLDNLGITYDETPLRILNTGFRKENNMLARILKSAKERGFNINMDNPSMIIIQQKKLKSGSKGNELKDKTSKIMEFLKTIKNSAKHIDERAKNRISMKSAKEIGKKKEKILDRPGQIELSLKPRTESLDERTKRIQDILNGRVPVLNTKPRKEDSSKERERKVKEFLDNLVTAKEKLPLDKKTKYIEDFLNNKVQVFTDNNSLNDKLGYYHSTAQNSIDEKENNANEILDKYSSEEGADTNGLPNTRRAKKKKKYRERDSKYESPESNPSDASASSDYERNPGNPFTIHRNKYKQNWLWNHFMDGDHMNINPFGPPFANMGPSGVDLFFGRKWWYYNQDDYKPMG